ncbi:PTS galactosamine/N-acetylgalactosamine transporter subunit IIA [Clostridiaceae bacterium M8S5]|nr:PTS galactosamine/N-acetylgalactosamine transporter subunit IIA [Clostridiaceae bacterium M8S5]
MLGIIICGHGNFATGIKSSLELVVGKQNYLEAVDFIKSDSLENLENKIVSSMDKMDVNGYLFYTDLPGGSPFKKCVEISLKNSNSEVVAGTNIPMILDIIFERDNVDANSLMKKSIEVGKEQIVTFKLNKKNKQIDEDGI